MSAFVISASAHRQTVVKRLPRFQVDASDAWEAERIAASIIDPFELLEVDATALPL